MCVIGTVSSVEHTQPIVRVPQSPLYERVGQYWAQVRDPSWMAVHDDANACALRAAKRNRSAATTFSDDFTIIIVAVFAVGRKTGNVSPAVSRSGRTEAYVRILRALRHRRAINALATSSSAHGVWRGGPPNAQPVACGALVP
jgi:hypothetical protein